MDGVRMARRGFDLLAPGPRLLGFMSALVSRKTLAIRVFLSRIGRCWKPWKKMVALRGFAMALDEISKHG